MKRILVVDDDSDIVFSVIDGLRSVTADFEFVEAHSGEEALEKLDNERIDLVLLDIMMPEIDGWTVAASIKGNAETSTIPIIFLTAKTDDLSKEMAGLTSDDYIVKPFEIDDLYQRIRKVIG